MESKKKAFTVMELIFVIVILGILATVGIPRLMTTRDDAKVAFCSEEISLFMRDLSSYYTSQGKFSLDIKNMTNIEVYEINSISEIGDRGEYYYVCERIKKNITPLDAAIKFKFSNTVDVSGNTIINFNAKVTSIIQGSVDGDLGALLKVKNIATDGFGRTHFIAGLRVKR